MTKNTASVVNKIKMNSFGILGHLRMSSTHAVSEIGMNFSGTRIQIHVQLRIPLKSLLKSGNKL
jgi:hypothetical protein